MNLKNGKNNVQQIAYFNWIHFRRTEIYLHIVPVMQVEPPNASDNVNVREAEFIKII